MKVVQKRNGEQPNRVSLFKYLGVVLDKKWNWKMHVNDLLRKLGHCLLVFNRISHLLDKKTLSLHGRRPNDRASRSLSLAASARSSLLPPHSDASHAGLKTLYAYFNGHVLPLLDYADIVWGDQDWKRPNVISWCHNILRILEQI